ncbi:MAG: alpha/beta hydrolase, partial [Spirochaetes bacterium]|nr:alpha/beta hydrolase [Spirochaetota bacterium]
MKKIVYVIVAIAFICIVGGLSLVRPDIPVDKLKVQYAPPPSKFLNLSGLLVHYRDEGKGFPVVLIHGTSSSLHTWDGWTKALISRYRVIRMDIPAFGLTGPTKERDYSPQAYVKFLEDFLNKLNISKFHLAGNSLGGLIAWNYALAYPQKVEKLVLIDAAGYPFRTMPPIFRLAKIKPIAFLGRYITPR